MKIEEIKQIYREISNRPILEYEAEIIAIDQFLQEIAQDERGGVRKISEQAKKRRDALLAEKERVQAMMVFEHKYADCQYICGVDEVGRGPLAGPVVTGAVILPKDFIIPYLNDSKQVKEERREELSSIIMEHAVASAIGISSERDIDELGIQQANYNAMQMAIQGLSVKPDHVLVDAVHIPNLDIPQTSIIKGDTLSVSIAAASIIAKVARDHMMHEYDKVYPEYGFARNVGYGTAAHIEALKKYGPCEIHRRSFIGNFV
jgi:ribonuclease HII